MFRANPSFLAQQPAVATISVPQLEIFGGNVENVANLDAIRNAVVANRSNLLQLDITLGYARGNSDMFYGFLSNTSRTVKTLFVTLHKVPNGRDYDESIAALTILSYDNLVTPPLDVVNKIRALNLEAYTPTSAASRYLDTPEDLRNVLRANLIGPTPGYFIRF